jgi:flagellar motor switch protein FliG
MSKALKKKYDNMCNERQAGQTPGGIHRLADIMHHMNGDAENRILQHFEEELPIHAQEIRDRIYSFEHIPALTNKEIRILIDEVGDDRLIALSLKGAGDEMRFKFLRNMSNNRATDIIEEMDRMGAVHVSDIMEARQAIVKVMRDLNENGSIIIKKAGEEYIE